MAALAKVREDRAEARDLRTGSDTRSANLGVDRGEDGGDGNQSGNRSTVRY
jgi:hypothetical protein